MSSWGNNDNAANAPYWAVNSTIVHADDVVSFGAAPTAENVARLYANTTANVYVQNETIGLFGIDNQEARVAEVGSSKIAHTGWILKTTGQGGRAGRVQHEVLVALSNMIGDGDGQTYANVVITLTAPSSTSVVTADDFSNTATIISTASLVGNTSATLTYTWQRNNASGSLGWISVANSDVSNVHTTGMTTNTLAIAPKTTANNASVYRLKVQAIDSGVTAYSSNATLTVTAP